MFFSVDPFHNEFVPIENVSRGIRISEEVFGREHVGVGSRRYLEAERIPPVQEFLAGVESAPAIMTGRAGWLLPDYSPKMPLELLVRFELSDRSSLVLARLASDAARQDLVFVECPHRGEPCSDRATDSSTGDEQVHCLDHSRLLRFHDFGRAHARHH